MKMKPQKGVGDGKDKIIKQLLLTHLRLAPKPGKWRKNAGAK